MTDVIFVIATLLVKCLLTALCAFISLIEIVQGLFGIMLVFVLVHGTGHGGWIWRFLVPLLRRADYDVYTPTLTGLGASSHLAHELNRISLDTHVKDITNMLFYEDLSEVVLVGHSYGGMVITGVTAKESQRLRFF
jgi:pimeloyl-ACP methyl ester carboxylesterase